MTTAEVKSNLNTFAAGDVVAYVALPNIVTSGVPVGFEDLSTLTPANSWRCLGWLDVSGYIFKNDETTKDIGAAGTLSAIRTVLTGGMKSGQITALEALNPYVRSLYDDVPIFPVASSPLKPATATLIASYVIPDPPTDNRYAMVFDAIDGTKKMRLFAPNVKCTARGDDVVQQADVEALQFTFMFYPGVINQTGGPVTGVAKRYINFTGSNVTVANYFT
jgi:hypothetical protein